MVLVAVVLIGRGLRALRGGGQPTAEGDEEVAAVAAPGRGASDEAKDEAQWQWFAGATQPGADAEPPARDLQRLPGVPDSPFDRAYARLELTRLGLALEGVGRGHEPMALISGRVLRIGDLIAGYELVSIDRSGVTLVNANGVFLDLAPQDPATRRRYAAPAGGPYSGGAYGGGAYGGSAYGGGAYAGTAAGPSDARFRVTQTPDADGLLSRIYLPDGRLDLAATHPGPIVMERERAKGKPYDRFKPWPEGPFPPAPSSFTEREFRNSARPNLPPEKRRSGG